MSPTGIPDFGQNPTTNPTSPTYDSGEDATRLLYGFGSQARSGRWVYATGFEDNSLATLYISPLSTGTGVIGTTNAYMGARSLTLTTAATTNDTVSFQKIMLLPGNRMGMEVMWSKQSTGGGPFEIEFTISSQARGVDRNRFRNGKIVLVVGATLPDAKLYYDVNGTRTLIRDVSDYVQDLARYWHYVKLVYDINGNKIVRVYFDDLTIDLEVDGYDSSGTSTPINQFSVQLKTKSAKAIIINFDNFIVTADEPGQSVEYTPPPPPPPGPSYLIDALVVAGGGGGAGGPAGSTTPAGGGAGELIEISGKTIDTGIVYNVIVGTGGTKGPAAANSKGTQGGDSQFDTAIAKGGGYGTLTANENPGGSGAGGNYTSTAGKASTKGAAPGGGTAYGNAGGTASTAAGGYGAGGGGGAGSVGGNGSGAAGGARGAGRVNSITGTPDTYAAGGLGGLYGPGTNGISGTANSGNGGDGGNPGAGTAATGGDGGSGVVILSIPTASYSGVYTGTPTITTSGSNTILKFTSNGSYTG